MLWIILLYFVPLAVFMSVFVAAFFSKTVADWLGIIDDEEAVKHLLVAVVPGLNFLTLFFILFLTITECASWNRKKGI